MAYRTHYVRRGIGLLVASAPVGLAVASLAYALLRASTWRPIGLGVTLVAFLFSALNAYLSWGRFLIHRLTNRSVDNYGHISPFPLIGSLVAVVGTLLGFGSVPCAALGLLAIVLDTGGPSYFVIVTWRDRSLWDRWVPPE